MRRGLKIAGLAFVAVLLVLSAMYVLRTRIGGNGFAVRFVKHDPTVIHTFGRLRTVWSNGAQRVHNGLTEHEILVSGDKAEGAVYLDLNKRAGVWEVGAGHLVIEGRATEIPLALRRARSGVSR